MRERNKSGLVPWAIVLGAVGIAVFTRLRFWLIARCWCRLMGFLILFVGRAETGGAVAVVAGDFVVNLVAELVKAHVHMIPGALEEIADFVAHALESLARASACGLRAGIIPCLGFDVRIL